MPINKSTGTSAANIRIFVTHVIWHNRLPGANPTLPIQRLQCQTQHKSKINTGTGTPLSLLKINVPALYRYLSKNLGTRTRTSYCRILSARYHVRLTDLLRMRSASRMSSLRSVVLLRPPPPPPPPPPPLLFSSLSKKEKRKVLTNKPSTGTGTVLYEF